MTGAPVSPIAEPRPLRVFYMGDTLNIGGTENQMVGAASRLKQTGVDVEVGCIGAHGPLLEVLGRAHIPVREFSVRGGVARPNGLVRTLGLARYLRARRFDVVHTHDVWSNLMGVPAAFLARVPVIVSSRRDLGDWWWYTPRHRRMMKWVQGLSHRVVANSNAVKQVLVERDGFERDKVCVIRNGVDLSRFRTVAAERSKLIPSARIEDKLAVVLANMNNIDKGHGLIVDSAARICPRARELRFVLIGDGEQRPNLERRVAELGLSERFMFLGHRYDVPELLSCCDLSILASSAEGLPNAVLESMAAGLPVIATSVGGTPEIIDDGVNGLLVPPGDPEPIVHAIARLLDDETLAAAIGRAGNQRIRSAFPFERVIAELQTLYRSLLRHQRPVSGSR